MKLTRTSAWQGARLFGRTRPDTSAIDAARMFVGTLSHDDVVTLAVAGAHAAIVDDRRITARREEMDATRSVIARPTPEPPAEWRERPSAYPFPLEPLQYTPPDKLADPESRKKYDREFDQRAGLHEWVRTSAQGRDWVVQAAVAHEVPLEDALYAFGMVEDAMRVRLTKVLEDESTNIRLEVSALLNTSFSLSDGKPVTWGRATIADHEQCIAMLMNNATANMATAARHRAAIRMISDAGVSTLEEVQRASAA